MSRSEANILSSMIAKITPGFALGKRGGVFDQLLRAAAVGLTEAETAAEAVMIETDPRSANKLLPDFERLLGPDHCGRDIDNPSLRQRQRLAHQRWTAVGGQSHTYLTDLAAKLGFEIEIEEFWPSRAGGLRAGQRLIPEGEQFSWRVRLNLNGVETFVAGGSQAGDPLGKFIQSGMECELRRIAHAHTTPVFSYTLEEAS